MFLQSHLHFFLDFVFTLVDQFFIWTVVIIYQRSYLFRSVDIFFLTRFVSSTKTLGSDNARPEENKRLVSRGVKNRSYRTCMMPLRISIGESLRPSARPWVHKKDKEEQSFPLSLIQDYFELLILRNTNHIASPFYLS